MPTPEINVILDAAQESELSARQLSIRAVGHESAIRTLKRGQDPKLSTVKSLCNTLGLEFYIGPPRRPENLNKQSSYSENNINPEMKPDNIREVIANAVSRSGLTQYRLATQAGLPQDAIRYALEGKDIKTSRLIEIAEALGLELYIGEPRAGKNLNNSPSYSEIKPEVIDKENDDLIPIPQLDIAFSGGHGSYPEDHVLQIGTRPFSRKWLDKKGLESENLALTRIHGDSMEPLLKDKDIVMLDQSVNQPMHTMPIAFRLDGELYIKLCQAAGDGRLMMSSANKLYDPIYIDKANPPADFAIIAAVVWHAHSWV